MPWDEYVSNSKIEYEQLLEKNSFNEAVFQNFFERHSAYVPGGFDVDDSSGHGPYVVSLISKPSLSGYFKRIPDFMWMASYSGVFHPIFIEIEAPNKKVFNKDNSATKDFNQAMDQLRHWKIWIDDPSNKGIFMKKFRLANTHLASNRFLPKLLLIYGRRDEFESNEKRKKLREQFMNGVGQIRSYDGLIPSHKCKDCFTVKVTEEGYEAIEVMPTIEIRPSLAEYYELITGKDRAIKTNRYMSKERKKFLIERFQYWDKWIRTTKSSERGIFNGKDVE